MDNRTYSGERFAKNFHTDDPTPSVVTGFRNGNFAAARIAHSGVGHGESKISAQAAFVLAYVMNDGMSRSAMWVGGKPAKCDPIRPGQIRFYNLEQDIRADIRDPLDFVYMYLPFAALNEFTDEHDLPRINGSSISTGAGFSDPVVAQLARSLLPALALPGQANQLFIDHVAFSLQSRFAFHYAGLHSRRAFFRGGLTPLQERRVKDLMLADIGNRVSTDQLARECGLSRSQFFRAFRWTVGKTPHQWLLQSRVELSKEILLATRQPVAEIASLCGFANPSHFTRAFSTYVGVAPAAWRAAQRN